MLIKSDQTHQIQALLPRRQALYYLIKDHPQITFATIARRFPLVANRTLHYDLKKLAAKKLIIKHGQTKGACYSVFNR